MGQFVAQNMMLKFSDPKIKRWYGWFDNDEIKMTDAPSIMAPYIFDDDPRSFAPNNNDEQGYVFEAKKPINFKSLVLMKRFDGMRDRYQGLLTKMMAGRRCLNPCPSD